MIALRHRIVMRILFVIMEEVRMRNAKNAFGINPIPKENAKIVTFLVKD